MKLEKNFIIGVSASIALYKTLILIRRLKEKNARIKVVMTPNAAKLISPQVYEAVSDEAVYVDEFSPNRESSMDHIQLKNWGDLLVVYPASANTIGAFSSGMGTNLLTTLFLAFRKPVILAPAMNTDMYLHPVVQRNIKVLSELGVYLADPTEGELACGESGAGKLMEPEDMIAYLLNLKL